MRLWYNRKLCRHYIENTSETQLWINQSLFISKHSRKEPPQACFGFTSEFHWVESRILRRTFPTCFDFDNASYIKKIFTDFSKCRYIISGTYIQKKCGSQRRKNQERSSRGISSIDDKFSGLFLNPNVSRCWTCSDFFYHPLFDKFS